MRKPRLTIFIMVLTIMLWAARPVALADGIDWLSPGTTGPESGEERPGQSETDWLTPDEGQEAIIPSAVTFSDDTEWQTPDEVSEDASPADNTDEETVIDVTVPGNGELVINPHRLPVELNGRTVRDQIINGGQILTSRSTGPIVVSASVTVNTKQSGGLTLTSRPIAEGEREKLAYLYVEFQNVPDIETEANWSGSYTGAANQLLATDGAASPSEVLRMETGPACAAYRLFGELSEDPEAGWQSGDRLSVTISFTFRPAEGAEPSQTEPEPEPEAESEAEPQSEAKEVSDHDPETTADTPSEMASAPAPVSVFDYDYDTEPVPSPEPENSPTQEDQPETRGEQVESFASGNNPDWILPPD